MNPLAADLDHVLDHTREAWEELRGARLFVTGGTGFYGCWILESLVWANDRLGLDASATVLTRSPERFAAKAPHLANHPSIRLIEGDVRGFDWPEGRFSHVIHAATEASAALTRSQPLLMFDTIVEGTRRTLEFAVAAGARRFLLASSGAVYGPQPPECERITETYSGGPAAGEVDAVYGEGKRVAEMLCAVASRQSGLECLLTRGFAFVGPRLPLEAHFAIGNFIRDAMLGRPIHLTGDGTPERSYLYAADLAIWLWTILVHGAPMRPYNVGSERAVSIAELARLVARIIGSSGEARIDTAPQPGAPPRRYVPSTARAREELGLSEWIPLEDAIARTAAWHCVAANQGRSS